MMIIDDNGNLREMTPEEVSILLEDFEVGISEFEEELNKK